LVRPEIPDTPTPVLDAEQLAIVAHRTGPLLVIGGPGHGQDHGPGRGGGGAGRRGRGPRQILVLTFSRRAAAALRDRIEARIGQIRLGVGRSTMSEPVVRTFPAYAFGPAPAGGLRAR
jgi:superfamily I DNA/RNA helicase